MNITLSYAFKNRRRSYLIRQCQSWGKGKSWNPGGGYNSGITHMMVLGTGQHRKGILKHGFYRFVRPLIKTSRLIPLFHLNSFLFRFISLFRKRDQVPTKSFNRAASCRPAAKCHALALSHSKEAVNEISTSFHEQLTDNTSKSYVCFLIPLI